LIEVARKKWQLPSPLAETMIPERGSGHGGGGVRGESGTFRGEDDGGEKDEGEYAGRRNEGREHVGRDSIEQPEP
jgi:hypothetical protein